MLLRQFLPVNALKFSIGHRLFASVLLAILAVAACAVFLLRQNVLAGFGDYAAGIELDRLEELSTTLARRYRAGNGWGFIPATDRQDWIAQELARQQAERQPDRMDITLHGLDRNAMYSRDNIERLIGLIEERSGDGRILNIKVA